MNVVLSILGFLVFWWVCGVINVASIQACSGDREFGEYNRTTTLVLSYVPGPVLTLAIIGWVLGKQPIKLGTRWGRMLGRKIDLILNS